MKHTITISALAKPVFGSTHLVTTPVLRGGVLVGSLEDARKLAAGYQPADPADTVQVIERTAAEAMHSTRAAALGL